MSEPKSGWKSGQKSGWKSGQKSGRKSGHKSGRNMQKLWIINKRHENNQNKHAQMPKGNK